MQKKYYFYVFFLMIISVDAQKDSLILNRSKDSIAQKDITDVAKSIFNSPKKVVKRSSNENKFELSLVPAAGYTLQTGLAAILSANVGFFESTEKTQKMSSISTSFTYSQYNQIIVPLYLNYWSKGNHINFISDIRYLKYPSDIYGLGAKNITIDQNSNTGYEIDYSALKIHESILKEVKPNLFLGIGYYYDQFWNITASDPNPIINDLLTKNLGSTERGSGPTLRVLFDSRTNQLNSNDGLFVNIQYRNSFKVLGSSENWSTLLTEARKYIPFPANSDNVLAFWAYSWLTTSKNSPSYLMIPSTGWDDQYNTGRGYIQGRFRGRNMYYYENAYRFGVTRNGFIGGVVFANAEAFSGDLSAEFKKIYVGYGLGIRVKFNKYSNTNLCLDYGFGSDNSKGFAVNLGEVF
jgi:hypothetical protein